MARNVLTIRELGKDTCWTLVQQALGIPDVRMQSDFMVNKVALLLFTRPSLPSRLGVTAAIRQMGGTTIYQGEPGGHWRQEIHSYQHNMLPIFGYYMDCLYLYGFPLEDLNAFNMDFPIINAGGPLAHPAHCLGDIACMLRAAKNLDDVETAWIGCANGTLYSLMEATAWFPFNIRIAQPATARSPLVKEKAQRLGKHIELVDSPEEAVKGARFIFAGYHGDLSESELKGWSITSDLIRHARPDARLMLSASPIRAIPIETSVLASKVSYLLRQCEYRLGVHKRILHWVFA